MYRISEEGDDQPDSNIRGCAEEWISCIDSSSVCESWWSSYYYELLGQSGEILQKSGERQGALSEGGRLHLKIVILNNYYLYILSFIFSFSYKVLFLCLIWALFPMAVFAKRLPRPYYPYDPYFLYMPHLSLIPLEYFWCFIKLDCFKWSFFHCTWHKSPSKIEFLEFPTGFKKVLEWNTVSEYFHYIKRFFAFYLLKDGLRQVLAKSRKAWK